MKKQTLFLGITLFSMFFGAGNLIFAPFLGAQAAQNGWMALAGFICTGVLMPLAAVMIIAPYGSAKAMISRIWKPLGPIFMTLVYLLIGPCIAIPRTAGTSMEMWTWLISDTLMARILYSVCFFAAAALLALYPGKLKDILGKVLGPSLLVLILMVCLPVLFRPGVMGAALEPYQSAPFFSGLNEGYQTMDILAAFCFGLIILLNIRQAKMPDERKALYGAALIAAVLLGAVYTLLAAAGIHQSGILQACSNGAQILSAMAESVYGPASKVLIGLIFLLACGNVCAGLLACCAEYFSLLVPKIGYRIWLIGFAVLGALMACTGLDAILSWSGMILSWICPIAIVLMVTGLVRRPKGELPEF